MHFNKKLMVSFRAGEVVDFGELLTRAGPAVSTAMKPLHVPPVICTTRLDSAAL